MALANVPEKGGKRKAQNPFELKEWYSITILTLHSRKVERRRWLPVEHLFNEFFLVIRQLECAVEATLVPNCSLWNSTQRFSASTASTAANKYGSSSASAHAAPAHPGWQWHTPW